MWFYCFKEIMGNIIFLYTEKRKQNYEEINKLKSKLEGK